MLLNYGRAPASLLSLITALYEFWILRLMIKNTRSLSHVLINETVGMIATLYLLAHTTNITQLLNGHCVLGLLTCKSHHIISLNGI